MNKQQWKAIYDFCKEYGYYAPCEMFQVLKDIGAVDNRDCIEDLQHYVDGKSYDDMFRFLAGWLL